VVANAESDILKAMKREIGHIPFVQSKLDELAETILRLKDDLAFYCEAQERGQQHWHDFHAPNVVAGRAVAFYEEALRRRSPRKEAAKRGTVRIKYVGRHSGTQTFWGARTNKRYQFGGAKRIGEVDARDAATGDSRNPGFLEMTEGGRGRVFRRVR